MQKIYNCPSSSSSNSSSNTSNTSNSIIIHYDTCIIFFNFIEVVKSLMENSYFFFFLQSRLTTIIKVSNFHFISNRAPVEEGIKSRFTIKLLEPPTNDQRFSKKNKRLIVTGHRCYCYTISGGSFKIKASGSFEWQTRIGLARYNTATAIIYKS